ncbi:MAG: septum formation family protein [Actinomycetota bacterium]
MPTPRPTPDTSGVREALRSAVETLDRSSGAIQIVARWNYEVVGARVTTHASWQADGLSRTGLEFDSHSESDHGIEILYGENMLLVRSYLLTAGIPFDATGWIDLTSDPTAGISSAASLAPAGLRDEVRELIGLVDASQYLSPLEPLGVYERSEVLLSARNAMWLIPPAVLPDLLERGVDPAALGELNGEIPVNILVEDDRLRSIGLDFSEVLRTLDQLGPKATTAVTYEFPVSFEPIYAPSPGEVIDVPPARQSPELGHRVGDCLVDVVFLPTPCTETHRVIVFSTGELEPIDPYDVDIAHELAQNRCVETFRLNVGVDPALTLLAVLADVPQLALVSDVGHRYRCMLISAEPLPESLQDLDPMRQGAEISTYGLRVGMCLSDKNIYASVVLTTVDCAEPHGYEVISDRMMAEVEWTNEREAYDDGLAFCSQQFTAVLGSPPEENDWWVDALVPSAFSWPLGDRTVACVIWQEFSTEGSVLSSG